LKRVLDERPGSVARCGVGALVPKITASRRDNRLSADLFYL
jgi:hypothetical protein